MPLSGSNIRGTLACVTSSSGEHDLAPECGAPEEFLDLERRLVRCPGVKSWHWNRATPGVIDVQMRFRTSARARANVEQSVAPTQVRFVRRIKF